MKKLLAVAAALCFLCLPSFAQAAEVGTSARACVIIDEVSGRILLSHNETEALPMASTTKIMTALLAIERGDLDAPVTCSRTAFGVPGTSIYLSEGETLSLRDMLYGLMLASGNDAATAIAEHIGGTVSDFCAMMTARAAALGCQNTVFLTPHGLPKDGHYTTAYDLALIAREAMSQPFFREMVSTKRATIPWTGRAYDRVLNNKNKLLATYEGATGIKTGYTKKAGRCLVFGAERNGMRIIGVVLNCADWFDEAARLMDLAFERYEAVTMALSGEVCRSIRIDNGDRTALSVIYGQDLSGVAPKGTVPDVEIDLPEQVSAPVAQGQCLGCARLIAGGEIIAEVPLIASASCARDDFAARWDIYMQNWFAVQ